MEPVAGPAVTDPEVDDAKDGYIKVEGVDQPLGSNISSAAIVEIREEAEYLEYKLELYYTQDPEGTNPDKSVHWFRYKQYEQLHKHLKKLHRGHDFKFPRSKVRGSVRKVLNSVSGDAKLGRRLGEIGGDDFVRSRREGLDKFIRHVAEDPNFSEDLITFIRDQEQMRFTRKSLGSLDEAQKTGANVTNIDAGLAFLSDAVGVSPKKDESGRLSFDDPQLVHLLDSVQQVLQAENKKIAEARGEGLKTNSIADDCNKTEEDTTLKAIEATSEAAAVSPTTKATSPQAKVATSEAKEVTPEAKEVTPEAKSATQQAKGPGYTSAVSETTNMESGSSESIKVIESSDEKTQESGNEGKYQSESIKLPSCDVESKVDTKSKSDTDVIDNENATPERPATDVAQAEKRKDEAAPVALPGAPDSEREDKSNDAYREVDSGTLVAHNLPADADTYARYLTSRTSDTNPFATEMAIEEAQVKKQMAMFVPLPLPLLNEFKDYLDKQEQLEMEALHNVFRRRMDEVQARLDILEGKEMKADVDGAGSATDQNQSDDDKGYIDIGGSEEAVNPSETDESAVKDSSPRLRKSVSPGKADRVERPATVWDPSDTAARTTEVDVAIRPSTAPAPKEHRQTQWDPLRAPSPQADSMVTVAEDTGGVSGSSTEKESSDEDDLKI